MDKDMSKPEHRLLAKSVTNGVDVSRELLGAAGAPSAVTVVAVMENETRDETIRLAAAHRQRPYSADWPSSSSSSRAAVPRYELDGE
jgi:hypothetical protein